MQDMKANDALVCTQLTLAIPTNGKQEVVSQQINVAQQKPENPIRTIVYVKATRA